MLSTVRTLAVVIVSLVACSALGGATPVPRPLADSGVDVRRVGSGTLTWFGFDIYDATLWTPDGRFDASFAEPVAFTLAYKRGFSRERLIAITQQAWDELELASATDRERWSRELGSIWVDVRKGSQLTTLVIPQQETRFYDEARYLGRIDDAAFGPAFLRIWLDERVASTALGDLRTDLLALQRDSRASKRDR